MQIYSVSDFMFFKFIMTFYYLIGSIKVYKNELKKSKWFFINHHIIREQLSFIINSRCFIFISVINSFNSFLSLIHIFSLKWMKYSEKF